MKRILSLVLVLIMLMSSALLVACDKSSDEPVVTTAAATTEPENENEDGGDNKPAAKPVEVDKVNGMTAAELYEKFYTEYLEAETYDVYMLAKLEDEDDEEFYLKRGVDSMYLNLMWDGDYGEYWEVDGVLYGQADGEKAKITGGSLEDLFGSRMLDEMRLNMFYRENMEGYLARLADVKLYSYKGEFYYELTLTTEEIDELLVSYTETYTERIYFDAQGVLKRAIFVNDYTELTVTMNSYGQPVTVKAPADADSYVEYGDGGEERPVPQGQPVDEVNGMNVREILEKFVEDYTTAETYDIEMTMTTSEGKEEIKLKLNRDSLYMKMDVEDQDMEMWIVDEVCYMKTGNEKVKMAGVSIEDIYGEGGPQDMLSQAMGQLDPESFDELEGVQLYYYEGEYYFYDETSESNGIVYINADGEITKMIVEEDGAELILTLNSYGKRVTINAPADADEFVEAE